MYYLLMLMKGHKRVTIRHKILRDVTKGTVPW